MSRIPIKIVKIKTKATSGILLSDNRKKIAAIENKETTSYLVQLSEKNMLWQKSYECNRDELINLKNHILEILDSTSTSEILNISEEKAIIVDEHYKTDQLCKNCEYTKTHKCKECLFVLESPLERQLYLELSKANIKFQMQYGLDYNGQNINTFGKSYDDIKNNFKEVLTIVDFYIENYKVKLCIYADGHTYHERTEDQALKDKKIDRKLQELGLEALRYTGKEIRENVIGVINEIKRRLE